VTGRSKEGLITRDKMPEPSDSEDSITYAIVVHSWCTVTCK
jgi:hypothetical protein